MTISVSIQVLVTGYGGFLGNAICLELLAHGYRVRGLARNHYPNLEAAGVQCFRGSASELSICEKASDGVDAVIHTAALAGVWGPAKTFEIANVLATDNLLLAATKYRHRAFVYTSSPSVTFDGTSQSNVDESAPYPDRWLCHYPRTKAIGEQHVLDRNSSTLSTCSLRPHLIWGPGDPHLFPRVIERCRQGRLMRVGTGKNLIDTVHVSAAAKAHRLALERMLDRDQSASGRPYFITDGAPVECWEWIKSILSLENLAPPSRSIRLSTAYWIGACLEILFKAAGATAEPPMTRFVAKQLGVDHYFNIEQAKKRLGYQPIQDRTSLLQKMAVRL